METGDEAAVLCAANSYIEKFYMNPLYGNLPEDVQQELKILCVRFAEEAGGILVLRYSEEGKLLIQTIADDGDFLYDEIEAAVEARKTAERYKELFSKLELYYQGMRLIRQSGGAGRGF